jgi:hypothetical protein
MKKLGKQKNPSQSAHEVGGVWWEHGTLHDADIATWHKPTSTYGDALATCADFVVMLRRNYKTNIKYNGPDELLKYVAQLVTAITKGTEGHIKTAGHMRVADVVVMAAVLLGWFEGGQILPAVDPTVIKLPE